MAWNQSRIVIHFRGSPEAVGKDCVHNHLGEMVNNGRYHGDREKGTEKSGPDDIGDRQCFLGCVDRKSSGGRPVQPYQAADGKIHQKDDAVQQNHKHEDENNLKSQLRYFIR